jgi:hypothetical protein
MLGEETAVAPLRWGRAHPLQSMGTRAQESCDSISRASAIADKGDWGDLSGILLPWLVLSPGRLLVFFQVAQMGSYLGHPAGKRT